MELQQRINNLPLDIVRYIIPFTYSPTNKKILEDIVNFHTIKQVLLDLYFRYWIIELDEIEPEDKYWLLNDIYRHYNNDKAHIYGYVDDFYNRFRRNILLFTKSKEEIEEYFNLHIINKNANAQINILLGLLTPNERNYLVNGFYIHNIF